jgi:acetyltransferase-like isoleucine patch superfamily enzyme
MIASHSGIYANNHNFADPTQPICKQGNSYKGITVEEDCWLGSGVRVLDGVTIGRGSIIGAGAVVTKDIPPYSIAVGVPAKVVSQRKSMSNNAKEASAETVRDRADLLEESVKQETSLSEPEKFSQPHV